MDILSIAILIFIIMESPTWPSCIFSPAAGWATAWGCSTPFTTAKARSSACSPPTSSTGWRGVKLIFILLLAVILAVGTEPVRVGATVAMILSIAT